MMSSAAGAGPDGPRAITKSRSRRPPISSKHQVACVPLCAVRAFGRCATSHRGLVMRTGPVPTESRRTVETRESDAECQALDGISRVVLITISTLSPWNFNFQTSRHRCHP